MDLLEQLIIDRIRKEGPLSFKTYMDMALYYPGLGYYSSPETTIGREGDFYTSPHLHPVFGAMIGKQLMEMWIMMGRPADFHAVEIGAGTGYLCRDMFDYLLQPSEDLSLSEDKSGFLRTLRYVIVEPYEHFQRIQKELLRGTLQKPLPAPRMQRGLEGNILWKKSLREFASGIKGCVLSNELLDAFPVHVIEMDAGLKEVYVTCDRERFREELHQPGTDEIARYLGQFHIQLEQGYRTEINLEIKKWLEDINTVLSQGFVLTIDYGYTAKEYYDGHRSKGTLLCYHNHVLNENPYQNIGKQDITAHVNFSSLKKWGEESGLMTVGYSSQGPFFVSSGIDEVITELYADSPDYLAEISKIKGLILPQGMGESHSILIQYKGDQLPELRGFALRNHVENL